ncbi:MAG: HAD-IIIA family hydrolase [Acholeplasmatales bacterium]|nr:HAD-IIIA family hydrolase [Acholeplasmatales bacterium]
MYAVIMAGGKGTRIQSIEPNLPKPMIKICGKPVLEHQIDSLKNSGITDIVLVVGYLGEKIKEYFKDGKEFGVNISYISEDEPLGTAGALYYLKDRKDEEFILVFGDVVFDVDFDRFIKFHKNNKSFITLLVHPNSHPYDSDVLVLENKKVIDILSKNEPRNYYYMNLVNSGIYCLDKKVLDYIKEPKKIDLEKNIITHFMGEKLVYGYRSTEYVKDMGTPERIKQVESDYNKGLVSIKNLKKPQKCIFVDRDGTLNDSNDYVRKLEDFKLYDNVPETIKRINESGYLVICITNQPVISRGECSRNTVEKMHLKLGMELGEKGAYLDDLAYCPHHPDKGFVGEIESLKIECDCRKPRTGMIDKMVRMYNIDVKESWFVGDMTVDVKTGKNAKLKTILVETGFGGSDKKYLDRPDFKAKDLAEAVDIILKGRE